MTPIHAVLQGLPFVITKRLTAREGFFTAGRMFALLGDESLLLRLPVRAGHELVETERAQPLIEPRIPTPLSWVALPLDTELDEIRRLAAQSHEATRVANRRGRARVRRRRRTPFPA